MNLKHCSILVFFTFFMKITVNKSYSLKVKYRKSTWTNNYFLRKNRLPSLRVHGLTQGLFRHDLDRFRVKGSFGSVNLAS